MALSVLSRGGLIGIVLFAGFVLLSLSRFAGSVQSIVYAGYSLAIPFIVALMVLGGVYFGARHLLTS